MFVCLSVSICLVICLSVSVFVSLSIRPSVFVCVHLSVRPVVCLCVSVCPSVSICPYVCLWQSVDLSICRCLSACLSVRLSYCLCVSACRMYVRLSVHQVVFLYIYVFQQEVTSPATLDPYKLRCPYSVYIFLGSGTDNVLFCFFCMAFSYLRQTYHTIWIASNAFRPSAERPSAGEFFPQ